MIEGEPSRTASSAALHRAAHQLLDDGSVFPDPVAVPITGWPPQRIVDDALLDPRRRAMRVLLGEPWFSHFRLPNSTRCSRGTTSRRSRTSG
jgi:hypothetical protein